MLNSIPDFKNFLENGVDNGILTYEKSLVLERDNEIMAAMEMYADEFSVIQIFLHRKFPELNKFNTTSVDISTPRCFLILCDYLTRRDGCIPQFLTYKEGPEDEDEELSSSTKSSDDFDVFTRAGLRNEILSETVAEDVMSEDTIPGDVQPKDVQQERIDDEVLDDLAIRSGFDDSGEVHQSAELSTDIELVIEKGVTASIEKHELTPKKHRLRQEMRKKLEKQCERMKRSQKGNKKLVLFNIGDLVSVSIPKEDWDKMAYSSIKGTIVDIKPYKRRYQLYRVATEYGTLDKCPSTEGILWQC